MKLASTLILLGTIIIISILWLTGYKSAFEADQACHYEIMSSSDLVQNEFGCDHDIETRQWLLYEKSTYKSPAKVLKRFSY